MKTMKKVAAVLFALLLVLSSASLSVSAEGRTGSIGIQITSDVPALPAEMQTGNVVQYECLYPGDIVTFTINISTDFKYTAMRWPVMYTTKAFEPVINGDGDTAYGNVRGSGTLDSSESYLESDELPTNSEAFGGAYSKTNYSGIQIQWTAGTSGAGLGYYYEPSGSDCLTFQLRVKDGYTKGSATVAIPTTTQAKKVFYYQGIDDPHDLTTLYKLTASTCTITSTPCTVDVVSESAGIIPKANSDIVLNEENDIHYIYGFTPVIAEDEDLDMQALSEKYISTTGGATYTLESNAGAYGTGAVIHVFDANGSPVDDYTIVIFGDINGDAQITMADVNGIISAICNEEDWTVVDEVTDNAMMYACDIDGDNQVDWPDENVPEETLLLRGYPDQTQSGIGLVRK